MLKDFKSFILRGNTVDLAVAVVIGAAFGAIVTSLVKDVITPLIAAIGGKPDFSSLYFSVNHSKLLYRDFINTIVAFIIVAVVVFFLVVKPLNKLMQAVNRGQDPEDPTEKKCPECLSSIPLAAKRCAFCASKVK